MNLKLVRFGYLTNVTLGRLFAGDFQCFTLEEPWRADPDGPGGQRREGNLNESCIPDGAYNVRWHTSAKYPGVWALVNHSLGVYYQPGDIPAGQKYGRSAVLIHQGNTVADILGCIVVGDKQTHDGSRFAVLNSRATLEKLRGFIGQGPHTLQIRPTAGTSEL